MWGTPTVVIILFFCLYFTVKSRFMPVTRFFSTVKRCIRELRTSNGGISAASSMATALGGTIGIGSISGVGVAIAAGGAGSVFWMWVTGFLGCMLKYAETSVAVKWRAYEKGIYSGGAMYALRANGKKAFACIFALACIAASFGTGGMTQSYAVAESLKANGIPTVVSGVFLALTVFFALLNGRKGIAKLCEKLVPVTGLIYLLCAFFLIIRRIDCLPSAFLCILRSAFGINQISGGVMGCGVAYALRTGVARGVFSSEAGMGSSPIVHSANQSASPETQGEWGILEMTADIFVFSTVTALFLLQYGTTDVNQAFYMGFGYIGNAILPAMLFIFGFASIISWCFYADACISFLTKNTLLFGVIYRVAISISVFFGAIMKTDNVWNGADILNIFMIIPNLYLVFIKRKEICKWFGIKQS